MRRSPNHNAFSLVEVALSLAILSVAMVGVLALLPVGLDSARQVHAEAVAVQVVRGVISEIEASNRAAGSFLSYPGAEYESSGESVAGVVMLVGTGQTIKKSNPYFSLKIERANMTPNSCRYFLTLHWPKAADTSSPMAQVRTFVSDQVRTW